jgi:hypothetical protein
MRKYPARTRVSRTENDDQECAREVPIASAARDCSENSQQVHIDPMLSMNDLSGLALKGDPYNKSQSF